MGVSLARFCLGDERFDKYMTYERPEGKGSIVEYDTDGLLGVCVCVVCCVSLV